MLHHKILSGANPLFYGINSYGHTSSFLTKFCCCYAPNPQLPAITVPLIPTSQCLDLIKQQHDAPSAGHLGCDKTIIKVRQLGYWVGMLQDIDKYCREYIVCHRTKLPAPSIAPLTSMPIGKPWQMVAVDI